MSEPSPHNFVITGTRQYSNDTFRDLKAYNRISGAKSRLMRDHPFWGFMALDLVLVELPEGFLHPDPDCETLCTDGYHIFYSSRFIHKITEKEVEFAVAHEIYHCLFGHTGGRGLANRRGDRDSGIWGYATDYVINADLKDAKIGQFITTIKILDEDKYLGWAAEVVYEDLIQNPPPGSGGGGTLDVHIEMDFGGGNNDGDEQSQSAHQNGVIKVKTTAKQAEIEQARWEGMAIRAIAQVESSGEGAGSVPSHLRRLIKDMHKPKIDWRSCLRQFIVQVTRTGYSYTIPDKRSFSGGLTLPGYRRRDNRLEIAVSIDTSGSVGTDQLSKFFGEMFGILASQPSYKIHLFCFEGDVDPATYMLLERGSQSPDDQLKTYIKEKLAGGGGTRFQAAWDFMREKKIKPRGHVMFTDGYPCDTSWHDEGTYCPSMFVTVGNGNNWKAPFGMTIPYEAA